MSVSIDRKAEVEEQYSRDGNWEELIEQVLEGAESAETEWERTAFLLWAAHIYEQRLGDPEKAAAILELLPPEYASNGDDGPTPPPVNVGRVTVAPAAIVAPPVVVAPPVTFAPPVAAAPAVVTPPAAVTPPTVVARPAAAAPSIVVTEATPPPEPAAQGLDGLIAAGRWSEAVATLLATAEEEEGKVRASYLFAAAKIVQHELKDGDRASALLNQALDLDPTDTKLIEALYRLRANRKEWQAAEDDLVRMIGRMQSRPGSERLQAALWRRLGDLYRVAMRDRAAASEAYNRALTLDPSDQRCRQMLQQLAHA